VVILLLAISGYSIVGYCWLLAIVGYFIADY
jgi:hypothetical protein